MSEEKAKYRLFALDITDENIEYASHVRFSRITPLYILVYTSDESVENGVEIEESETVRLSQSDEQWLRDVNLTLIVEDVKGKSKQRFLETFTKIYEELEKNLANEAEKVNKGGDGNEQLNN